MPGTFNGCEIGAVSLCMQKIKFEPVQIFVYGRAEYWLLKAYCNKLRYSKSVLQNVLNTYYCYKKQCHTLLIAMH